MKFLLILYYFELDLQGQPQCLKKTMMVGLSLGNLSTLSACSLAGSPTTGTGAISLGGGAL